MKRGIIKNSTSYNRLSSLLNGYSLLFKIMGLLPFITDIIRILLSVSAFYAEIYISSLVINELAGDKKPEKLLLFVLLILLINVVSSAVKSALSVASGSMKSSALGRLASGDPGEADEVSKSVSADKNSGEAFIWLCERYEGIITGLTSAFCSAALSASLFVSESASLPESLELIDNNLIIPVFLFSVILISFLSVCLARKPSVFCGMLGSAVPVLFTGAAYMLICLKVRYGAFGPGDIIRFGAALGRFAISVRRLILIYCSVPDSITYKFFNRT